MLFQYEFINFPLWNTREFEIRVGENLFFNISKRNLLFLHCLQFKNTFLRTAVEGSSFARFKIAAFSLTIKALK